ncbi:hypothetical protein IWZ03DRAFT_312141 [Phyllosticta citriasiana]|uniref:Uncharacterized protein n=1 Tax=Phyllosticta citriasiana TaxID=595635 RepID=A0ABR1KJL6_9PEZI
MSPPHHSEPMVIPSRNNLITSSSAMPTRPRGPPARASSTTRRRKPTPHNPEAMPPAVAAILAVTSIPPPRRHGSSRRRRNDRPISIDELFEGWRAEDKELSPGSFGSPLDILLERPDDCDTDDSFSLGESISKGQESTSPRSVSSGSFASVPDLDEDRSVLSWSSPSTPRSSSLSRRERRKERPFSSPPKEECPHHPLMHYGFAEEELPPLPVIEDKVERKKSSSSLRSTFTSNLTASFQVLKSAAKSFSNFTAPSVPPDDLLTRSILSPRFTSEMRPKDFEGTPDPALRRYLNPSTSTMPTSPTELTQQLHEALIHGLPVDEPSDAPMIQMQTYERRSRSQSRGRRGQSSADATEAGRALSPPGVRQREPRENSDFLRVIVLEMNMRRGGKLDSRAVGRARIWLPPRKTGARGTDVDDDDADAGRVPLRWVGVLADAS